MGKLLEDRIALVTGASRGIGRAAALALSAEGAHIVALARPRSQGALEELDDEIRAAGGAATLVPVDLTDGAAIDQLGAALYERWGRIDILLGNAGMLGPLSPVGHVSPKDWDKVFQTNVTANYRLIRSMDPLLRQSGSGRAIFVTSGAAHKAKPYWAPYAASKAALEELVRTYAAEMQATPVKTALVDPGPMRTAMRKKAVPGENADTLPPPESIGPLFVELAGDAVWSDTLETGTIIRFADWQPLKAD
ncbi:SDR family NAD(P)-dependent oxidoreductase [Eilatimonas milleporae]|uniref:NAD(P)-dependent dehydrogenase (Short-subunit alcohol dehydrogenase family) n=1 Tax=Eilatimonas milleporae TaxID=911205 RepID=A0A3M0CGV9_9PROT|nr:SDR family NAD(P)-dependent oxidoreductase [Eilatimonas milleporae]RMB08864.1 NAD(P)-dependent dehydrogenase (short-subunit alcohol dehydrogenase family) [Eilatimonas milleporae]